MNLLEAHFSGTKVLVTGHTGFKGSWISEWLLGLGAEVVGVALEPNTKPAMFEQLDLERRLEHHILDIRDREALLALVERTQPRVVFHLAAQSLVRYSYAHPVETFAINVMGTAHILEALRLVDGPCEAVLITTDKCYESHEATELYREEDPMGGHDPYSASKGAAEIVISSYRRSFFDPASYDRDHRTAVGSSRAGNVIGGGDWASDRIVPDAMRAIAKGEPIAVRNPDATRPWQHVLEPLGGYLLLAASMARSKTVEQRQDLFGAFNLGPDPAANRSVRDLVEAVIEYWPGTWTQQADPDAVHEAKRLNLSIEKAERVLGWRPVWDFENAVQKTVDWYRNVHDDPDSAGDVTRTQIAEYSGVFGSDL